ncbi:hypothetical protein Droror1_Dr00014676 [Drosera rotundifolia]
MKMKRKRSPGVPPKVESFIDSVVAVPFESIEEPLKNFVWDYEKGDFHHWVDLFTHFDSYFEKHINPRKDLHIEEDTFLNPDPPFPKEAVLQILRVVRIILENCSNKHFYSSFEQHLSSLLASTDADVVEASLQTLATFLKKTIGKYSIKDASLSTKLFAFSQGWGGKDEGLGLTACALENGCDSIACQLGSTVHFEFYLADESSNDLQSRQGLHVIHLSDINSRSESDLELLHILVKEYRVPPNLRFSLLTRLRFARAFSSLASRQQFTCIRLYAYVVLLQASGSTDPEPEFINELVCLLSFEDAVPAKIRILALLSLVALSQNRTRQPAVISAVMSGGHREILSSLVQKAVDSVLHNSSKWSVVFAEALLSLITILVSSSVGCAAMREAGFIPTLLPLLKDANTEHLHLVSTAVHVLEAFMDFSNPAAALFRDLGGLDDTVIRLKEEVSIIANGSKQPCEDSSHSQKSHDVTAGSSSALEEMQPLYTDIVISHHRKLLIKALLRAISLGTYAPGNTNRIYGSEESLLPQCLCVIFRRAKDFGGGVFSLAATVMGDLIHKDPTCYPVLDAAVLPSAFIDAIIDGVVCSAEALTCIPQCLDALCLNNGGLQLVKDRNALRCFVKIFTSKMYLHYLSVDTVASLSSGLDELMRHASSLRGPAVEMLIEILNAILRIGSVSDARSSSSASLPCSTTVPMETDGEEKNLPSPLEKMPSIVEVTDPGDSSTKASTLNVEYSLPDFVSNAARLLGTVLQNSDVCRMFNEKKGVEAVLQMFSLPLLPISASLGPTIYAAFKNFSPQHSPALARGICSFLKEHLKSTNELLDSVGGKPLIKLESAQQIKVLRCLSCVEGVLSLSNSLLKGTSTIASELGVGDSEVLKDIGKTYMEVLWQISLSSDSKVDEKQNVNVEIAPADGSLTSGAARESDDETNVPAVRYVNPVPLRNGSQSLWTAERDILSVIRFGEGLSRRRHGLTRIRAGRSIRYLDHSRIDSEPSSSIPETLSSQEQKKKSPDILISELLIKLGSIMRSFYANLVRGFTSQNRRRTDSVSLTSSAKNVGAALAKIYLEALTFSGNSASPGLDVPLSVKCRYLGKVVNDMSALVYDSRRRVIHSVMVNNFYVSGAFKELLTTFAATSQLLWTVPFPFSMSSAESEMCETSKSAHSSWLLSTLQSYCRVLEYFVNSSLLLSPTSSSQNQLLVQPIATGLSIGLFPVPREPEVFIRMLQSQVLDVILPVWNNSMFPNCYPAFITSILSILTCIYSGVGDVKHIHSGLAVNVNQRVAPPPDESTIATIVEMGFSRARAEEALRRIESNSVEMAMEWLFNHPEDPLQEEDELARVLALSLGNSSEAPKPDSVDKSVSVLDGEGLISAPPVDDILATLMKLFQSGDFVAFPLTDLLVSLCNRNKGEDRSKVVEYLVQTLKHCPLDTNAFPAISHILAILQSEDASTREAAAEGGMVSIALDALTNLKMKDDFGSEKLATKSISTLLLILDNLLQLRPKITSESKEISLTAPLRDSSVEQSLVSPPVENHLDLGNGEKEADSELEKLLGRPTGYLTLEDGHKVLGIACDLLRLCVPSVIMQAVLQLCARLTKIYTFALYFLESGGMTALFGLPRSCLFPGYDVLASTIVRHLLEDPPTLQAAMESEIRQTLSSNRHAGRITTQTFLTSMAPVISRDPVTFMKAAASVCELESSAGRSTVVLSKDRERDKGRTKGSGTEAGLSSNETLRISETKIPDGAVKCPKGPKRTPANLSQVLDQLLDIVMQFPTANSKEESSSNSNAMEVDLPAMKMKGKSKVGEVKKTESESLPEKSAELGKVTFVLKLLGDILLMHSHAAGVILRRDAELCQLHGSSLLDGQLHGGIIHHVLHRVLPLSADKGAGNSGLRVKLFENASSLLAVLCGRSSEGRKRVVNELVNALSSYSSSGNRCVKSFLVPDCKILAFSEFVCSTLAKNSSSGSLLLSGYSPDIAKSMIDGGIVPCLANVLQTIDLDHPDSPRIVNFILKALDSLTCAANASEQASKSDSSNKKISAVLVGRSDEPVVAASANDTMGHTQDHVADMEAAQPVQTEPHHAESSEGNHVLSDANPAMELGVEFVHGDMEDVGVLHVNNQHDDDDIVDEDDDMGEDGDNEEDEDEGDDDDDDIAEDGAAMMSLGDTDMEDHEDAGLEDEYNDDIVDDEDDDYHENRVIEVRLREALDGFDHLQVLGRSGSGILDFNSEPFEGVNVDDLFGLHRPLNLEQRRNTNRPANSTRSSVQHPLLTRTTGRGDLGSPWSSGGHGPRESESVSGGTSDVARFFMLDAPVLSFDQASSSLTLNRGRLRGPAPPPLSENSAGMGSLQSSRRRGSADGRWTDDGLPQTSGQASAVAQAVEELYVSLMPKSSPVDEPVTRQQQDRVLAEEPQSDAPVANPNLEADNSGGQLVEDRGEHGSENDQQGSQRETDVSANPTTNTGVVTEGVDAYMQDNNPASCNSDMLNEDANTLSNENNGMDIDDVNDVPNFGTTAVQDPVSLSSDMQDYQPEVQMQASDGIELSNTGSGHDDMVPVNSVLEMPNQVERDITVFNGAAADQVQNELVMRTFENGVLDPSSEVDASEAQNADHPDRAPATNEALGADAIDPSFLEALPEDLRAEVLASQRSQPAQPPAYTLPRVDDIDPEFLAALPPDIQAEVLAQQRAQRIVQQAEGQPVDMDNASIIATLPPDLREEVLLTSSEAVLSALPSSLLAEAQMLRDRAMSHYDARSLFGTSHRLSARRPGLGFDGHTVMDRGVGVSIGRRGSSLIRSIKVKDVDGEPLLDTNALEGLIRLLRLAEPHGKGLLQRVLLNLCAHSVMRSTLVHLFLNMVKPEAEGIVGGLSVINSQRLYGCPAKVVYGRSQLLDGLPPMVLRRILETLSFLATNHAGVANILFYFDPSIRANISVQRPLASKHDKGKGKIEDNGTSSCGISADKDTPLVLFLKLLNKPLFLQSSAHLEQVLTLVQEIIFNASTKLENESPSNQTVDNPEVQQVSAASENAEGAEMSNASASKQETLSDKGESSSHQKKDGDDVYDIFLKIPEPDLRNVCCLLGREGLSDKVYTLAIEVLKKLASVAAAHCKFFTSELSGLAQLLSGAAVGELNTLKNTGMMGLSAGSMAGAVILRVLQAFSLLTSSLPDGSMGPQSNEEQENQVIMQKLSISLEPLWLELSDCISTTETQLGHSSVSPSITLTADLATQTPGSTPLPPGTQRLLPFVEAFFLVCEKLQSMNSTTQGDHTNVTATVVEESTVCSTSSSSMCGVDSQRRPDGSMTFSRFAEKHRSLLNAFIRQNPGLLEKSLSMMLKAPRLIDFDNKRAYFRSRIRQQHEQQLSGPLRISVRRAYVLEDSYNQLRMKSKQELKGRLNVQFRGEEGIDAGGLTREWYQLLSRVIFDKGALLFTTVGNNATFQPNPNSVYQTEHLSYFKFVGRVVAKALFDGQLLDVYFTRSFYKHILGVKVTYHDIEAVDPDYYKNLKWMLENDVNDIPDLTFSMDADEEKHILYEKTEVTDYELKPGGRNTRVTEETKHEYVDLVADHILTNAIRPQINSFLEGFNELVPRELISIFNDKELELLISGLPEIDLNDLKANTDYSGYTSASNIIQWFWEVVQSFSKEDMARFLQFVTGTSKVPLEGFKALQGISGPQKFQIHRAYGAPERLPSAHTCFNQLDLPEYSSKEQLRDRLLLAIHEASEGFGFG